MLDLTPKSHKSYNTVKSKFIHIRNNEVFDLIFINGQGQEQGLQVHRYPWGTYMLGFIHPCNNQHNVYHKALAFYYSINNKNERDKIYRLFA